MGLALLDESHRETAGELTSTGQIMGTLDYMAPEQGADTHTVDIRADVYSLGATLYKLLCGHAPFEGPRYSTQIKKLTALATAEPERIEGLRPEVPQELADLVHRMLSKTPAARPTPPTEVARLIAPFADGADLNRLFDPADAVDSSVSPTAETATDPTFIAETNVAQPATWDGPPGPSTSGAATAPFPPTASEKQTLPTPAPLSRANDAKSRTNAIAGEGPGVREQTQASPPPSSILNSQSTLSRPPRRPLGRYAAFAAPLLIGLAVIIINTKQGTVTVKTSDTLPDAVTIAVRQGGEDVQILDKDNNWTVHVRAGEYELEVRGGNDEFKLEEDEHGVSRLGVSRWGTTLVEVTHDPRSTEPTPMPANFALQFDGVDDYVAIPTLSMPEKGPWTIECRFSANDKYGDLFSYVGGLRLWIVPARSEVHWRARKSSGEFCEGRWPIRLQSIHTVALSYDEARLQLFVDGKWIGELDAPDVELARLPQNPPLKAIATLGSLPHPDTHLAGTIEQFRLSNTSRYTGDYTLHARFTPDEHTVCLYHFDEGDGDVLTDASGNGHHGKIVGATWVPADAPPSSTPTTNFALQFDGVDDYVDIPSLRLGTDSPWTIEGRYRTADVFGDIVSYSGGVRVWLSSRLNWDVGGEGKAFQAKPDWNANQVFQSHEDWTSFAVVYDGNGTTAHFFINGRKVVDLTADRIAVEDEAADQYARLRLVLGGLAAPYWEKLNPDSYFSGEIDELRISSSARYADDYSLTDRFEPDEQTVALYHFDEREGDA